MFTMSPLFVSMGAAAGGGGGPDPFVQSSGLINDSGHASTGYTWGTKPTLNNWVLVATIGWGGGGGPVVNSVQDNATVPNTFTKMSDRVQGTSRETIWLGKMASLPAGALTTTANFASAPDLSMGMLELTGLAASPFDKEAGAVSGSPSSPFTVGPTAALSQTSELVIALMGGNGDGAAGIIQPTGFTMPVVAQSNAYINMGLAFKVVDSAAAVSAQWSWSNWGGDLAAGLVTLKLA